MELNRYPVGTLAVLVDGQGIVQTVGNLYGYGEDLHIDDVDRETGEFLYKRKNPAYDTDPTQDEYIIDTEKFKYWENVVQFSEGLGYGLGGQQIYEIKEVPAGIEAPFNRWCYNTTDGFTDNPNYKEPEPAPDVDPAVQKKIEAETIQGIVNELNGTKGAN